MRVRWRGRITACCAVIGVVVLVGTLTACGGSANAPEKAASRTSTTAEHSRHEFTATIRNKTFEIDEAAYTTGKGKVSAVGLVEARLGDDPPRTGARTGFGEFAGSPLRWSLDDTLYFADGSIKSSGMCETKANADGTFTARCDLTVDGGSGTFEGATGTTDYTCLAPSADVNAIATCDAKGVVVY